LINKFKSSEVKCPIIEYEVSSNSTQITQEGCMTPEDSDNCRTVKLSTSLNGTFEAVYLVKAKGGAVKEVKVILDVFSETYE